MAELSVGSRAVPEKLRPERLRRMLGPLVAGGALLLAGSANAQTVSLPTTVEPTRQVKLRPSSEDPYAISYSDCIANDAYTFATTLTGYQGYSLEVWAGPGDCSDISTRTGSAPTCWKVYAAQPNNKIWSVKVRVQDMISGRTILKTPNGPNSATAADCDTQAASAPSAPQTLVLSFLLVDGNEQVPSGETSGQYKVTYDLVGPSPPTNVSAGIGGGELVVNWTASDDPDLLGYRLYCDPPPGGAVPTAGASDAGLDASAADSGAAGSSGEAGTNPNCPSTALVEGKRPAAAYLCGSVSGQTNSSGTATGLTNGTLYAVGVAGYDLVRNAGPLSNVACGTPEKINGFFNLYKQAGGKGGGGYCDVGGRPAPGALWAFGGALLAAALRRRRRQKRC